jgi:hypothetical protein
MLQKELLTCKAILDPPSNFFFTTDAITPD